MKLFLPFDKLYIDGEPICKVTGEIPPKGIHRVDVSYNHVMHELTPIIGKTYRIYWNNPLNLHKDCFCLFLESEEIYKQVLARITDAIEAMEEVTFTTKEVV